VVYKKTLQNPGRMMARRATMPRPNITRARRSLFHRDRHQAMSGESGLMAWQCCSDYNRQSLVESAMFAGALMPELCPTSGPTQKLGAMCSTGCPGSGDHRRLIHAPTRCVWTSSVSATDACRNSLDNPQPITGNPSELSLSRRCGVSPQNQADETPTGVAVGEGFPLRSHL
jgi:hypothetical protein